MVWSYFEVKNVTKHDHDRSPNDQRSDMMNPNNPEYQAAMDNHSDQLNPNNDAYWSSRESNDPDEDFEDGFEDDSDLDEENDND